MLGLPDHPKPESLLKPPWEARYNEEEFCWIVRSPNKPKNALVFGYKWIEEENDK